MYDRLLANVDVKLHVTILVVQLYTEWRTFMII